MRTEPLSEPVIALRGMARPAPAISPRPAATSRRFRIFTFASFLGLVLVLQLLGGAFRNEFAGYPDEGAHYITGLMMRDYVAAHKPVSFRKYAENYYLHYPKVALGHWPPFFYVVEAAWGLVLPATRTSLLFLMAFITAAMAFTLTCILERDFGRLLAAAAGVFLILLPVMQSYSGMIMADTLVGLLSFWAVLLFARFLERQKWRDAVWFGVVSSLAILTKGTGFALALVPPLTILFTGRLRLLRKPAFWIPALIVVPLCGPWYWITRHMLPDTWQQPKPGLDYAARAIHFYGLHSVTIFSVGLFVLAVIGFSIRTVVHRREVDNKWPALGALLVSTGVLALIVPAGLEERFLIPAVPAVLAFAVAGLDFLAQRLTARLALPAGKTILLGLVSALFFLTTFSIPRAISFGFASVADYVLAQPGMAKAVLLVSSDATGDSMFISEMAMREARPGHYVLRASKVLCDCSWSGDEHGSRYATPEQMMDYLSHSPIQVVLEDESIPARSRLEFPRILAQTIAFYPQRWKLLATYPITRQGVLFPAGIRVYSVLGTDPSAALDIDLHRMLNKSIQLQPR
jgi:hypothetical protein